MLKISQITLMSALWCAVQAADYREDRVGDSLISAGACMKTFCLKIGATLYVGLSFVAREKGHLWKGNRQDE